MDESAELDAWVDETATTALSVQVRGETVVEIDRPHPGPGWYGLDGEAHLGAVPDGEIALPFEPTGDGRMRQDVASAQKSLIAVMVAVGVDRGMLAFDDPVTRHLGSGWSRAGTDHESAVTVRHLLSMTSGLDNLLESDGEPGAQWEYSLGPAWHLLKPLLARAAGSTLDEITAEWILEPLGMGETTWVSRPGMSYLDGTPFEALCTTARDLTRFGQLVLDHGEYNATRLVSAEVLAQLFVPSQAHNPAYGLLWWLNGQRPYYKPMASEPTDEMLIPAAPSDMVVAAGAGGQLCMVTPSLDAVVVRLGGRIPGSFDLSGAGVANSLWPILSETIFATD